MRRNRIGLGALLAVFIIPQFGPGSPAAEPPTGRGALRYDGKPFEYWRDYLKTELKAERRAEAVRALGEFGAKGYAAEAAAAIVEAVRDLKNVRASAEDAPEQKIIDEAMTAVQRIGAPAFDVLVGKAEHSDVIRHIVVGTVGRIFGTGEQNVPISAQAFEELLRLAESDDPEIRHFAVDTLGFAIQHDKKKALAAALTRAGQNERLVQALMQDLDKPSSDPWKFDGTGDVLSVLGPSARAATPALVRAVLKGARDWKNTLQSIGVDDGTLVPLVAEGLKSVEPEARIVAAQWLGEIGPNAQAKVPDLLKTLDDPDPKVRLATITALGCIAAAPRETVPALDRVFSNADEFGENRVEAALSLGKFGSDAKGALASLLIAIAANQEEGRWTDQEQGRWMGPRFVNVDQERSIRRAALRAAERIGEPRQVVPIVVKALAKWMDDNPAVNHLCDEGMAYATMYLANLDKGAEETIPVLVRALHQFDHDPEYRPLIIRCLGRMGPVARDALPALREAAKDPALKRSALAAISSIEGKANK